MQELCKKLLQSIKTPILVFFFIILISSIVLSDNLVESYNDPVLYSTGDTRWCRRNGVCTLSTLTTDAIITRNLSVIGEVFNVTMNLVTWNITTNFNVGGNLEAKNITAENFIGSHSAEEVDRDLPTSCPSGTCVTGWGDNLSTTTCTSFLQTANGSLWNKTGNNLYPSNLNDNIGIGTSSPSHKLEVSGSMNVSGNVNATEFYENNTALKDKYEPKTSADGLVIRFLNGYHEMRVK